MQGNTKKKIAPIVVAALVVLYIAPLAGSAVYAAIWLVGTEEIWGIAAFLATYALIGGAVIVGILTAMTQRLREISRGEEDEARKY